MRSPGAARVPSPSPPASPPLEPPHGSSRATGGVFRGGKEKFSMADGEEQSQDVLVTQARVNIFISEYAPHTVDVSVDPPYATIMVKPFEFWKMVLPGAAIRLPMLKGEYYHPFFHSFTLN